MDEAQVYPLEAEPPIDERLLDAKLAVPQPRAGVVWIALDRFDDDPAAHRLGDRCVELCSVWV